MRAVRILALVAVAAAAVALVVLILDRGGSDSAEVGRVVKDYDAALADGEGDAACSLLTGEAQRAVARRHGYGGTLGVDATKTRATCADGIENRYLGDEAVFDELKFAPLSDVEVRGDDAQATIKLAGSPLTATLVKDGAGWRISAPPLP